ncbi:hypothetical protein [Leptolyngbya iicbica]|uniref:2'-5' RNA ligase n=2 Tax=Cyanophyceae TaxID=3028117 RepID=A0A4Q7E6A6_9CYAN|nr:hypothetical protein [Leptolyngbya sp. LK]RZM77892.1 hypothetical protein DYY88_15145 [Leptolyngbya sp. LK]
MPKLIVYACPVGELADQLAVYFERSRATCGPNLAHHYMPHCTLTGFFEDTVSSIPHYVDGLARSLQRHRRSQPQPPIGVKALTFRAQWHGLELSSDWLKQLIADFASAANSPTRSAPLRLKDWLHLSLAYGFESEHRQVLQQLAEDFVKPQASVAWELRFYERHEDNSWTCHQQWPLF